MAHARPEGPVQGHARCGLDLPYAQKREAARRELDNTIAGRDKPYGVPRDDTAVKNPDGDLANPSAMPRH